MDSQEPRSQMKRNKNREEGIGDNKGSLRRKVANEAIKTGEGSALGTMVIQADQVTMTINFNF
nr:MAG: hypothetical protein 2 [Tombusviridae sp.]